MAFNKSCNNKHIMSLLNKFFQAFQPVYETAPTQAAVETAPADSEPSVKKFDLFNAVIDQTTNPIYAHFPNNIHHDEIYGNPFQNM